ncbi:hypothetical protein GGD56_003906 [Rhizobium mongolense]|uniref:Uncharacterized protein n=1 Tax=Rhizobium mongolense TaxID=57676 RepID=A0ABR6IQ85_9HYPH|nr:hypothetical protein [Rhizobium mongolense]
MDVYGMISDSTSMISTGIMAILIGYVVVRLL